MKTILVTTGATVTFKSLLDYVVSEKFIGYLLEKQPVKLIVQYGNETDSNSNNVSKEYFNQGLMAMIESLDLSVSNEFNDKSTTAFKSSKYQIELEVFGFSHNISSYIEESDLVISHAGTGSIIDVLQLKKPLVVVVNDSLMHNHQLQVAQKLSDQNCLLMCEASQLNTNVLIQLCEKVFNHHQFTDLKKPDGKVVEGIIASCF